MNRIYLLLVLFGFKLTISLKAQENTANTNTLVLTSWRSIVSVGIENYASNIFAYHQYGDLNGYRIRGVINGSFLTKHIDGVIFARFGGSVVLIDNVILGMGNIHLGVNRIHHYKKIYSQFYIGINIGKKVEKRYDGIYAEHYINTFSGLNLNTPLLGYGCGVKLNKFHYIEIHGNLLIGPLLQWHYIGGHSYDNLRANWIDGLLGIHYVYELHSKKEK